MPPIDPPELLPSGSLTIQSTTRPAAQAAADQQLPPQLQAMKSFTTIALVLLAAVAASTSSATQQASHIRVRVHSGTHQKFYVTPMGKQCAYNASIDPSMYPCRDGGICVRKNETFGVCELPSSGSDSGSGSDDSDSNVELPTDGSSFDESDDSQSSVDDEEEDEDESEFEDDSSDSTV